jgi:uncharacterized metal-binding protein
MHDKGDHFHPITTDEFVELIEKIMYYYYCMYQFWRNVISSFLLRRSHNFKILAALQTVQLPFEVVSIVCKVASMLSEEILLKTFSYVDKWVSLLLHMYVVTGAA